MLLFGCNLFIFGFQIILCRPAVRKARVAVIRKMLKKIKILKSCKVEALKIKKLKKSERLFEKVQIMKRVKDDEVTKFALRYKDLGIFLQKPKLEFRENALARLAKHNAIVKKINAIREQIPNWESELPDLLDTLGNKGKKKSGTTIRNAKTTEKSFKRDDAVVKKSKLCEIKEKVKDMEKFPKLKSSKPPKNIANTHDDDKDDNGGRKKSDNSSVENNFEVCGKVQKIKKIDDPFFIEKKVFAPKLVTESLSGRKHLDKVKKSEEAGFKRRSNSLAFHGKLLNAKKDLHAFEVQKSEPEEEKLHPSWAAKKLKLIGPFQGKKIKFTDD